MKPSPPNRVTLWSCNSASGQEPKITESRVSNRYLHAHVNSSLTRAKKVEKQMWCVPLTALTLEKEGNPTPTTTRMDHQGAVLGEISQAQKKGRRRLTPFIGTLCRWNHEVQRARFWSGSSPGLRAEWGGAGFSGVLPTPPEECALRQTVLLIAQLRTHFLSAKRTL